MRGGKRDNNSTSGGNESRGPAGLMIRTLRGPAPSDEAQKRHACEDPRGPTAHRLRYTSSPDLRNLSSLLSSICLIGRPRTK